VRGQFQKQLTPNFWCDLADPRKK